MNAKSVLKMGDGTGIDGRSRPVWKSDDGVIWCGCPGWIRNKRRPRTCTHLHCLADEAALPESYLMSEEEVAEEAKLLRRPEPTGDEVREALRESHGVKLGTLGSPGVNPNAVVNPNAGLVYEDDDFESPTFGQMIPRKQAVPAAVLPKLDIGPGGDALKQLFSAMRKEKIASSLSPDTIENLLNWVATRTVKFNAVACFSKAAWDGRFLGIVLQYQAAPNTFTTTADVGRKLEELCAQHGVGVKEHSPGVMRLVRPSALENVEENFDDDFGAD